MKFHFMADLLLDSFGFGCFEIIKIFNWRSAVCNYPSALSKSKSKQVWSKGEQRFPRKSSVVSAKRKSVFGNFKSVNGRRKSVGANRTSDDTRRKSAEVESKYINRRWRYVDQEQKPVGRDSPSTNIRRMSVDTTSRTSTDAFQPSADPGRINAGSSQTSANRCDDAREEQKSGISIVSFHNEGFSAWDFSFLKTMTKMFHFV